MICYVLAMGKQHLGLHVGVGYGIKIFWPGHFITLPDHLVKNSTNLRSQATALFITSPDHLEREGGASEFHRLLMYHLVVVGYGIKIFVPRPLICIMEA